LPVVEGGRLTGVITNGDLVRRGVLPLRLELQQSMEAPIRNYSGYERAREVMTANPITTSEFATVEDAGRLLVARHLKRLPVEREGRLVGVLSRVDILRAAVDRGRPPSSAPTLGEISRPESLAVALDAPLADVVEVVASTRLNLAILVDSDGHPQGLVTDAGLLRILHGSSDSATARLMGRTLGRATGDDPALRELTAGVVMEPLMVVSAEAPLLDVIPVMLTRRTKVMAVVDGGGRLHGIVDRADALRAVVG
jgi:CBS domain-containing protein